MIESLLIANRGEIARRIIRTARRLGIRAIAVYSEADAGMPFVAEADEAVCVGPANPAQSYRNTEAILAAAKSTGAQAIHPRSEEHTSELQSRQYLVCRLLLEKKKKKTRHT